MFCAKNHSSCFALLVYDKVMHSDLAIGVKSIRGATKTIEQKSKSSYHDITLPSLMGLMDSMKNKNFKCRISVNAFVEHEQDCLSNQGCCIDGLPISWFSMKDANVSTDSHKCPDASHECRLGGNVAVWKRAGKGAGRRKEGISSDHYLNSVCFT